MSRIEAIVVGGSTGALEALGEILPALPRDFAIPIALVLHLPPSSPSLVPEVLRPMCALRVREPDDKEPVAKGTIYVAPPNYHLFIEEDHIFSLSVDELVHFSRPSIDVLFESAADAYGSALVGVLLAGSNEDGARGLEHIVRAGGTAVVQLPATASAPTMPEAGLRLAATEHALAPAEIGSFLARLDGAMTEGKAR